MTLLQKLRRYLVLRKLGFSRTVGWREFKQPLTERDWAALIALALLAAIAVTLHYRNEYDVSLSRITQIAQMAQVDKTESELIIVSMLNGAVVEDGRLKTICALNAAGECRR